MGYRGAYGNQGYNPGYGNFFFSSSRRHTSFDCDWSSDVCSSDLILLLLPFLKAKRLLGSTVLAAFAVIILTMTAAAHLSDRRDSRTREQLARQTAQESAWRNEPFNPKLLQSSQLGSQNSNEGGAPVMFVKFCANCHGARGEGGQQGPLKFPPLLDVAAKPRRTADDIVALLKDPAAYGLQPPMRSFADKLTEAEMKEIAAWVVQLKR